MSGTGSEAVVDSGAAASLAEEVRVLETSLVTLADPLVERVADGAPAALSAALFRRQAAGVRHLASYTVTLGEPTREAEIGAALDAWIEAEGLRIDPRYAAGESGPSSMRDTLAMWATADLVGDRARSDLAARRIWCVLERIDGEWLESSAPMDHARALALLSERRSRGCPIDHRLSRRAPVRILGRSPG